jgi:acyl-CoA dehydrogenase
MFELPPISQYFSPDHEAFRASFRDFASREISPHVNDWDEAGTFPRDLYLRAAELGATDFGYQEEFSGTPGDIFFKLVLTKEDVRCGSGGIQASIRRCRSLVAWATCQAPGASTSPAKSR